MLDFLLGFSLVLAPPFASEVYPVIGADEISLLVHWMSE